MVVIMVSMLQISYCMAGYFTWQILVLHNIKALGLTALMIWHCCYCTKTFEVCGLRIYQSENKLSPLVAFALTQKKFASWLFVMTHSTIYST